MPEPTPSSPPLLEVRGVRKAFSGVVALNGAGLTLGSGEILALVGENGAGKSTLMKILAGALAPDAGAIRVQGEPAQWTQPLDARRAGVAVIHQELQLAPGLSASANLFLGQERSRAGFLSLAEERRLARAQFERLGVSIDPDAPCGRLSVAQRQIVEIAKALLQQARILVMDEPTAALSAHEVERLLAIVRELRGQRLGIIYISHRLDEVFAVADRVEVFRDGRNVGGAPIQDVTQAQVIEWMVGRPLADEFPTRRVAIGEPRLVARGLRRGRAVRDVSLEIRRGEVLGLAGLVGAGRTETARLLAGADRREAGEVLLDGRPIDLSSPATAIQAGIGLLTEDRKHQGLVLRHGARENFALPNLDRWSPWGVVRRRDEAAAFAGYVERLRIKLAGFEQPAGFLSGGNQQKVVLAKWLARGCEVLLFDEPTRGVDVGAKREIYDLINELAAAGRAILLVTSELPEALGMCDRILVLRDGRVAGEVADARTATQEQIMRLAVA